MINFSKKFKELIYIRIQQQNDNKSLSELRYIIEIEEKGIDY